MRHGLAIAAALAVAVAAAGLLGGSGEASWSADPFPVSGHLVELIGPPTCVTAEGETTCETADERLASRPCVRRFASEHPDWAAAGCGSEASFIDGSYRVVDGYGAGQEVYEEDHDTQLLAPNPWFAPVFDDWNGRVRPAGSLTLHARELVYGGADVIGTDRDGVPVLYVQRNETYLEEVSVFVRDDGTFPTGDEVAAALELAGLPDERLAASITSGSRLELARQQFR